MRLRTHANSASKNSRLDHGRWRFHGRALLETARRAELKYAALIEAGIVLAASLTIASAVCLALAALGIPDPSR